MRLARIVMLFLITGTVAMAAQQAQVGDKPTESVHRKGPDGLEGWSLEWPLPDDPNGQHYPGVLVIARNGRVIRRIEGDGFIWNWMFLDGGKQVAYQTGPLHFGLTCVRMNLATGKQLEQYDCYHETPEPEPGWVVDLEKNPPDW